MTIIFIITCSIYIGILLLHFFVSPKRPLELIISTIDAVECEPDKYNLIKDLVMNNPSTYIMGPLYFGYWLTQVYTLGTILSGSYCSVEIIIFIRGRSKPILIKTALFYIFNANYFNTIIKTLILQNKIKIRFIKMIYIRFHINK